MQTALGFAGFACRRRGPCTRTINARATTRNRPQIRVFCRVRPHPHSAVRCLPGGTSLALAVDGREHTFSFDRVFGPGTGQQQVFAEVSELVQSALDGYHVCLFSYGQTGAGKTYTMQVCGGGRARSPTTQCRAVLMRARARKHTRASALAAPHPPAPPPAPAAAARARPTRSAPA